MSYDLNRYTKNHRETILKAKSLFNELGYDILPEQVFQLYFNLFDVKSEIFNHPNPLSFLSPEDELTNSNSIDCARFDSDFKAAICNYDLQLAVDLMNNIAAKHSNGSINKVCFKEEQWVLISCISLILENLTLVDDKIIAETSSDLPQWAGKRFIEESPRVLLNAEKDILRRTFHCHDDKKHYVYVCNKDKRRDEVELKVFQSFVEIFMKIKDWNSVIVNTPKLAIAMKKTGLWMESQFLSSVSSWNLKLVQRTKESLRSFGFKDFSTGHGYEFFAKLANRPSWNVANAQNLNILAVLPEQHELDKSQMESAKWQILLDWQKNLQVIENRESNLTEDELNDFIEKSLQFRVGQLTDGMINQLKEFLNRLNRDQFFKVVAKIIENPGWAGIILRDKRLFAKLEEIKNSLKMDN
jgi:hypothetical protein